jgi:hypothetical protein
MTGLQLARYLWAAPGTLLGAVLALPLLISGGRIARHSGVLEVCAPTRLASQRGGAFAFDAITFGHVVLARDGACHNALRAHEREHVRQYEVWGIFFLIAYPLECAFQWLRGRHPYRDNRFEVQARRAEAAQPSTNVLTDSPSTDSPAP